MKILYAVQATGNGHISRAIQILPYLKQYGEVDIFLSGENANLNVGMPVKYSSKGLSLFYGNSGKLDYYTMFKKFSLKRIWNEAKQLPVEKYDLVLNDFESITSLACKFKNVPSIQFGHQASFQSALTPRPKKKDILGEFILKSYAPSTKYLGLHFESYDTNIYNPIIKSEIIEANAVNEGHVTVYLSHYSNAVLEQYLLAIPEIKFEVFSKEIKTAFVKKNIYYYPISNTLFTQSMIKSAGVITGAGFETPAEAMYLGKKLMCLPIRGQYEQLCNAAALANMGVSVIDKIEQGFNEKIKLWFGNSNINSLTLQHSTYQLIQLLMEEAKSLQTNKQKIGVYEPNNFALMNELSL